MVGKPRHYIAGAITGFTAGFAAAFLLRALRIGFIGILVPMVTGYLIGALVAKASGAHGHSAIQWTAAASTGLGLICAAVLIGGPRLGSDPRLLFSALIASGLAAVAAGR